MSSTQTTPEQSPTTQSDEKTRSLHFSKTEHHINKDEIQKQYQLKGTPFTITKLRDGKNIITLGSYLICEERLRGNEIEKYLQKNLFDIILKLIFAITDFQTKNQPK